MVCFVAPDDDELHSCRSQTYTAAGLFQEALEDEHMMRLQPELPEVRLWKEKAI